MARRAFQLRDSYNEGRLIYTGRIPSQLTLPPFFDPETLASALGAGTLFLGNRKMDSHAAPLQPLKFLMPIDTDPCCQYNSDVYIVPPVWLGSVKTILTGDLVHIYIILLPSPKTGEEPNIDVVGSQYFDE